MSLNAAVNSSLTQLASLSGSARYAAVSAVLNSGLASTACNASQLRVGAPCVLACSHDLLTSRNPAAPCSLCTCSPRASGCLSQTDRFLHAGPAFVAPCACSFQPFILASNVAQTFFAAEGIALGEQHLPAFCGRACCSNRHPLLCNTTRRCELRAQEHLWHDCSGNHPVCT